VCGWNDSFCVI